MQRGPIDLITVSREFGAGGSDLARALGVRLGWPVLDDDLVHRVAEQLRVDDKTVEHFHEHAPSLLARIATVLIIPQPDMYSFPSASDLPSHDTIAAATTQVIIDAAKTRPLIVVGHGAQCIFGGEPTVLNTRVIAPVSDRIRRIAVRMGVDFSFAAGLMRRADHDRRGYVQRYFHQEWRNDLLYDVQFNTGRVAIDDAVESVVQLIAAKGGAARGAPSASDASMSSPEERHR